MREKLKEELSIFSLITTEIIEAISSGNYDQLNGLFQKRQETVERIDKLDYNSEEFSSLCQELDIEKIDMELKVVLTDARNNVKSEINKLSDFKNARKGYTKEFSVDSLFCNKKI